MSARHNVRAAALATAFIASALAVGGCDDSTLRLSEADDGSLKGELAVYVADYALRTSGPPGYFWSWAIAMAAVLVSLALVRRHIERNAPEPALATH